MTPETAAAIVQAIAAGASVVLTIFVILIMRQQGKILSQQQELLEEQHRKNRPSIYINRVQANDLDVKIKGIGVKDRHGVKTVSVSRHIAFQVANAGWKDTSIWYAYVERKMGTTVEKFPLELSIDHPDASPSEVIIRSGASMNFIGRLDIKKDVDLNIGRLVLVVKPIGGMEARARLRRNRHDSFLVHPDSEIFDDSIEDDE